METSSEATQESLDHKSKRKKRGHSAEDKQRKQLLKQNPFSVLADCAQGETSGEIVTQSENSVVNKKQPPLVVKNVKLATLIESVPKCGVEPVYKMTRFGIKVLCNSAADYEKVQSHLQEKSYEYYTHDKPSDRPYRVVVRGLPLVDTKELQSLLKTECNLDAQAVHLMKRKLQTTTQQDDELYLIQFPKGYTTLKKLSEVKYIANIVIRWQSYRSKRADVTQCMNCLHHGHGTRNCHLKGRCNNCGESHNTDKCPKQVESAKRCANCGGPHSATDRSCQKRAEYIHIRQQATISNQPGKRQSRKEPAVPTFNMKEYPPLSNATEQIHPPNPVGFRFPSNAGNNTRRLDPRIRAGVQEETTNSQDKNEALYSSAELWTIFNELCERMKQCRTRADQIQVLGYMVCRYGVN